MMCTFSHILMLLDCSPVDDAIVDYVIKMAKCGGIKVTLVHVVHSHTLDQDRALKKQADETMKKRIPQFEKVGIKAESLLLSGEPEKELDKEISTGKYDLVALATHGHRAFSDILYGSVSDHLKHSIDIPLLMVKGKHKKNK